MNRKLTLNADDLRVDSFEMAERELGARGTVHGYATEAACTGLACGPTQPMDTYWDTCQTCAKWC